MPAGLGESEGLEAFVVGEGVGVGLWFAVGVGELADGVGLAGVLEGTDGLGLVGSGGLMTGDGLVLVGAGALLVNTEGGNDVGGREVRERCVHPVRTPAVTTAATILRGSFIAPSPPFNT